MATRFHFNPSDDTFTLNTVQDCKPILDWNAMARSEGAGWSPSREWVHVGRVPTILLRKWQREEGIDYLSSDPEMVAKLMAKIHEYNKLKIADGDFRRAPVRETGRWNR